MEQNHEKQELTGSSLHHARQLNPYVLSTPFLAIVALHLIGWLFPGSFTWGFDFWSQVSPAIALGVFTVAILLLIPPVTGKAAGILHPAETLGSIVKRAGKLVVVPVTSICLLALFYFFRSRALVYGDAYTLVSDITNTETLTLHFQYKFQLLAVYFYRYACPVVGDYLSVSIEQAYALINAVGGVVGFWAIVRISGQVTSTNTSRAFVLLGSLTSASVILFFGYVENYTWATTLSLWTLSFAISYSQNRKGLAGLVIVAPVAFMFHMIALPFLVVAFMALFLRGSPSGNYLFRLRLRTVNTGIALGSLLFVAFSQLGDIDIFVTLWPGEANRYWILSADHLSDVLNELILVAGPGLALLTLTKWYSRRYVFAVGTVDGILGTVTMLTLLAAFWIDPGIGAPRDWDLLSLVGFPLSIWACYRFSKLFPLRDIPRRWLVPVIVVMCVHLGANLYEKNRPDLAVERLDALLEDDLHYRADFREAKRCAAWGAILANEAHRDDLAIKYLARRANVSDDSYRACFGLGEVYGRLEQYDSAAKYIEKGLATKPDELHFLVNLAKIEKTRGRYEHAVRWGTQAAELAPDDVDVLNELAIAYGYCERYDEALRYFRRAYGLSPSTFAQPLNLGLCYGRLGIVDSAYYYVSAALPLAPEELRVDLYGYIVVAAIESGKLESAARHLDELRLFAPAAPEIPDLTAILAEAQRK